MTDNKELIIEKIINKIEVFIVSWENEMLTHTIDFLESLIKETKEELMKNKKKM